MYNFEKCQTTYLTYYLIKLISLRMFLLKSFILLQLLKASRREFLSFALRYKKKKREDHKLWFSA